MRDSNGLICRGAGSTRYGGTYIETKGHWKYHNACDGMRLEDGYRGAWDEHVLIVITSDFV